MKIIISIIFIALTIYSYIYDFQQRILYIGVDSFNFLAGPEESVVVSFGKNESDYHAFAIKKKDIKQGGSWNLNQKTTLTFLCLVA